MGSRRVNWVRVRSKRKKYNHIEDIDRSSSNHIGMEWIPCESILYSQIAVSKPNMLNKAYRLQNIEYTE